MPVQGDELQRRLEVLERCDLPVFDPGLTVLKAAIAIKEATDLDNSVTTSGSIDPGRYDQAIALYMDAVSLFQHVLKCASTLLTASSHPVQVYARDTTWWSLATPPWPPLVCFNFLSSATPLSHLRLSRVPTDECKEIRRKRKP